MKKFKVGDRVKYVGESFSHLPYNLYTCIGIVVEAYEHHTVVKFDRMRSLSNNRLQLVSVQGKDNLSIWDLMAK